MTTQTEPMTLTERVRASESRKIAAGGRRIPSGILPADAAEALAALQARTGASAAECIRVALIAAAKRKGGRREQ